MARLLGFSVHVGPGVLAMALLSLRPAWRREIRFVYATPPTAYWDRPARVPRSRRTSAGNSCRVALEGTGTNLDVASRLPIHLRCAVYDGKEPLLAMTLLRTCNPTRHQRGRFAAPAALIAGVALTGAPVAGCSVLYDLSTDQCNTTADCAALGGVFAALECIDHLCQQPSITGCVSNAECMDADTRGIGDFACVNRECIQLTTAECPILLPQTNARWFENLRSDDPLIVAGTGVIRGTVYFDDLMRNYDLALTELDNKLGGLQGGRKVVMLGCQALPESDEDLDRMMTHLTSVVKVPGMIAALSAENLQRAFVQAGDAADMFFMSPLESDPTLELLQDRGLVWHIGPDPAVVARAYAPLLARALTHLGLSTEVRVATVVTPDARFLSNMVSTIEASPAQYGLRFNGKAVADNRREGNYLAVSVATGEEETSAQVQALIDFKPHVVVSLAGNELLTSVVPALESSWDTSSGQPKPFYLLSPFNYNDTALDTLLASVATMRTRFAGVNGAAAEDSTAYDAYVGRWDIAFPEQRGVRGLENYYDAAYYLLYAAAGAGQALPSDLAGTPRLTNGGTALGNGMARLLSGVPYQVGPDDMPSAMSTLLVPNSRITLNGTLGPPNFNPTTGARESFGSVWCVDATGTTRADVLRYVPPADQDDATTAELQGTFPCFPGF